MSGTATSPDLSSYATLDDAARARLWQDVRTALDGPDWELHATAVWAEVLHDPDFAGEAWRALTEPLPGGVVLARVLDISGPVHADLKLPLLEALAADPGWHDPIIRALWFAVFEDYGDIDVPGARVLAERLEPSIAVSEHEDLRAALEQLPDDCRSYVDWQQQADLVPARPIFASARAATELDRRQGERRRLNVGPPAGVAERRRQPDRRGMWNMSVSDDPGEYAAPETGVDHASDRTRLVMVVVGCLVAGVVVAFVLMALGVLPS